MREALFLITNSMNNKILAKNTLMMYVRMLFLMFISFYTSRVVLQALGEENFGIYNIVGGIVVLFAFLNGAMTTGTQRHISYELGKKDGNINKVYSACVYIHIGVALFLIIPGETIGLWFLNNKMNFPPERMVAVNWVYQLSIITCIIGILRIPYNALIIAKGRMSFYAYMGVAEGLLKLVIVYLLSIGNVDRLVLYALLIMIVSLLVTIFYVIYCKVCFRDINMCRVYDISLYKQMLAFSGWTIFGSLANIARTQGIGIIINIFYGVALNAAIGIANQVNAGICQFVTGFQQAFNPRLTKVEASKDREYQFFLINKTAKYSFLIILFFAVPILANLDYILTFWLGKYPIYSKEICFWIVIASLIDSVSGPLWVTIFATGKIKTYQVCISILILIGLPLTYLCGVCKLRPEYAFAFQAMINALAIIVRVLFMKKLVDYPIASFVKKVLYPIIIVSLMVMPIFAIMQFYGIVIGNFNMFIMYSFCFCSYEAVVIFMFGLNLEEKRWILNYCKSKFLK